METLTYSYYGHWIYYKESDEVWRNGGFYRARGIGEKSITLKINFEPRIFRIILKKNQLKS